jgi:S1-C subfamily serine protease
MYGRPLTPEDKETMKLESDKGVVVTRVQEDSFAAEIGLRPNDVIVSINRQPVGSTEDIKKLQASLKGGDAVAFRVMRPNPRGGTDRRTGIHRHVPPGHVTQVSS